MASARDNPGLQIIFSIFLGLMVAAFIGVGVYTFYPPHAEETIGEQRELRREESVILTPGPEGLELTQAERDRLREVQARLRELNDKEKAEEEVWVRNTSIILILFATTVMSISLIRADKLPVVSNGLLLGGVFTMLYGVGWIILSGTSYARFAVITVALVVTLALGYMRFVRARAAGETPGG